MATVTTVLPCYVRLKGWLLSLLPDVGIRFYP